MPERAASGSRPWGETIGTVVDGWLFSDVKGELPDAAILPLENPDLYNPSQWSEHLEIDQKYKSVTIARFRGREIGVLTPKLGAPAVAMTLDAVAARGVKTVIGVGFCGGIADGLHCGDVLVPTAAVSADGTSPAYVPERFPAVADRRLATLAHELGPDNHDGLVYSLDAVCTQDDALIDRCRALTVAGIDMETAAAFTVGRLNGLRVATILVVSDHPGRGEQTDPARLLEGVGRAIRLSLEVAVEAHTLE